MWSAAPTAVGRRRRLADLAALAFVVAAVLVPASSLADGASSEVTTVAAEADARVVHSRTTENFGRYYLRVNGGDEPTEESYVRFVVGDVTDVQQATLRIYAYFETTDGPAVQPASNHWSESDVTWSSRPEKTGSVVADSGAIAANSWVEFDVSSVVRGPGTYTFALVPTSSDGANFNSREMGSGPELVLRTSGDTPPPPPPPPPPTDGEPPSMPGGLEVTATTQTSVALAWTASVDNVGVAGYGVYRNGTRVETTTLRSATVGGLACATRYTFAVDAADAAGNRSDAAQLTATTASCPPPATNAFYVSPTAGSDSNPGTVQAPWKTLAKAMATLTAGQTAYLRAGNYVEATNVACSSSYNALTWSRSGTSSAPITLRGYPGEERNVVIRTKLKLAGDFLRLTDLVVDRNYSYSSFDLACTGEPNVNVLGDDVVLRRLEVRNSNMSGMWLKGADRAQILDNWIHDNGAHARLDHGIYLSSGSGGTIANNVIERGKGFGIQLYPDPSGQLVTQNTIVGHSMSGIVLDTSGGGITVANNVLAFNTQYGISYRRGSNCRADRNVIYGNSSPIAGSFSTGLVIAADPLFVDRTAGDLRVRTGSPAVDAALASLSQAADYAGVARPQGSGPDIGAFER